MKKDEVKKLASMLIQHLNSACETREKLRLTMKQLSSDELFDLEESLEHEDKELNRLYKVLNSN